MDTKTKIFVSIYILALIIGEIALCTAKDRRPKIEIRPINEVPKIVYSDLSIDNSSLIIRFDNDISEDDIKLMALVTMAEAGGEKEDLGKRLVIDTILNRVEDPHFPNTIRDVIFQKNAFTPVESGKIWEYDVDEHLVELIREELNERTNYECIFFMAGDYSKYGAPLFNVNNQYFSKYA